MPTDHHSQFCPISTAPRVSDAMLLAQLREAMRPMSEEEVAHGKAALQRLFECAHGFSGQPRKVACFLLSLYDSSRFSFDLNVLRALDKPLIQDCLAVLYMNSVRQTNIKVDIDGGEEALERLAARWNLEVQSEQ